MKYNFSPSTHFLKKELERRGYEVQSFQDPYLLYIEKNGHHLFTHAVKTFTSAATFFVCKDKYLTKQVLQRFGFPVARGMKIKNDQLEMLDSLQFPVVAKPLLLSGGEDISIGLATKEDVGKYMVKHPQYEEILVEELLQGEDTRILIINGKFFAACRRKPASVIGDGVLTIAQIIERENRSRSQKVQKQEAEQSFDTITYPILMDEDVDRTLKKSGLHANSIPKKGEEVLVRSNSNISTGGTCLDVTLEVGEDIRKQSEEIAAKLGMIMLGVDIMTQDLSKPLDISKGWGIVELNGSPGIYPHILPHEGISRDPSPLIVDQIDEYFKGSTEFE